MATLSQKNWVPRRCYGCEAVPQRGYCLCGSRRLSVCGGDYTPCPCRRRMRMLAKCCSEIVGDDA